MSVVKMRYYRENNEAMKKYIIPEIEVIVPIEPLMQETLAKESNPNDEEIYGKETDLDNEEWFTGDEGNLWDD